VDAQFTALMAMWSKHWSTMLSLISRVRDCILWIAALFIFRGSPAFSGGRTLPRRKVGTP
jgi:hypothetical protein